MDYPHFTPDEEVAQASSDLIELQNILDSIDPTRLIDRLKAERRNGRPGHSLTALWRAYLLSFALNLPSTNALVRTLGTHAELRMLCGFNALPHRSTFCRFIMRLDDHLDIVTSMMRPLTDALASDLADFGKYAALDSTSVRTHGNPHRKVLSDPDAEWTLKHSSRAKRKDGMEWFYGYKMHMIADATYGIPIAAYVTSANRHDSRELPNLLDAALKAHEWFDPRYVIADRGYDSKANHQEVLSRNAIAIIGIRRANGGKLIEGKYTTNGVPVCEGKTPMTYVRSEEGKGHLYICKADCRCPDEWVNKPNDPRRFGQVRRDSAEWRILYAMRQAVERVFKSLKQSRRLEAHCVRGLRRVALHCAMATLVFQATTLVRLRETGTDGMTWQVRRVA